jgi:hypothetical protein
VIQITLPSDWGPGANRPEEHAGSRDLLQAEIERLVDEQFIEAAVFTEDEGILEARDQKDVVHFEGHQVFEAFKALFGVHYGQRPWGYPSPASQQ